MHFLIPFTRAQSDITPVSRTGAPYCHHHRTASSDSTEYWVWNGPDDSHDGSKDSIRVPDESIGDDTMSSQESTDSPTELGGMDPNSPPRLDQFVIHDHALPPSHEEGSFFETTLDLTADGSSSSQSDLCSFASDLPSESLSPILRANRQRLDVSYASRLHMRDDDASQSNLFGLGIFDLTRKDDPLHAFDGLGVVHIQSRIENGQEDDREDECKLSQTFLDDLEGFFLVKNLAPSSSGEGPTIRVEEAADAAIHTPKVEQQPFSTQLAPISPVTTTTPKTFTSRIKGVLRPFEPLEPSRSTTLPRSSTTGTLCSSSSSFFGRTCCALRSQHSLNTLRAEHALLNAGSTSTSTSQTCNSGSGIDEESGKRSRGVPGFQLANRQTLPLSASTRNLSVSVSMDGCILPRSGSHAGSSSNGLRTLQTHSVRDLRDLSVLGTISSELKKTGKVASSGSDIDLVGASGAVSASSSGSR